MFTSQFSCTFTASVLEAPIYLPLHRLFFKNYLPVVATPGNVAVKTRTNDSCFPQYYVNCMPAVQAVSTIKSALKAPLFSCKAFLFAPLAAGMDFSNYMQASKCHQKQHSHIQGFVRLCNMLMATMILAEANAGMLLSACMQHERKKSL